MAEAARKAALAQEAASKDEEMTDAETTKPDEIVEPEEKK
jgi:heat shock protein 4